MHHPFKHLPFIPCPALHLFHPLFQVLFSNSYPPFNQLNHLLSDPCPLLLLLHLLQTPFQFALYLIQSPSHLLLPDPIPFPVFTDLVFHLLHPPDQHLLSHTSDPKLLTNLAFHLSHPRHHDLLLPCSIPLRALQPRRIHHYILFKTVLHLLQRLRHLDQPLLPHIHLLQSSEPLLHVFHHLPHRYICNFILLLLLHPIHQHPQLHPIFTTFSFQLFQPLHHHHSSHVLTTLTTTTTTIVLCNHSCLPDHTL
mmetsp:Transcript_16027/g.26422  ORF Transcript_16027/g.26422 Transcript_16027/m.26422 type:complete len:252 (-) Transcript_16027:260-1015(-)